MSPFVCVSRDLNNSYRLQGMNIINKINNKCLHHSIISIDDLREPTTKTNKRLKSDENIPVISLLNKWREVDELHP